MFCRYSLRTTDVALARRFYDEAIGLTLPSEGRSETSRLEAWPLHERAIANGAPPHWLGQLAVDDVERSRERLVELGGERLGPTVRTPDGTHYATLRDPFGAVVAVRAGQLGPADDRIAWHQLHTRDAERAWALYSELFGWIGTETLDVPDPVGGHQLFAWRTGTGSIGSIGNTGRWPGVHAHWLFYFVVADIDAAVVRIRALGGAAMNPIALAAGRYLAACEDPEGAAFGLIQSETLQSHA
jgi:uncharacterized protein